MKIYMNTGGLAATNGYLVANETAAQAIIIDAPHKTVAPLLDIARRNQWRIIYLILTHGHWDHIGDHQVVTDAFPEAKVLIHRLDEPRLMKPESMFFPLPYRIPARRADAYLEDGQTIALGDLTFSLMHTPGHSPGHVVLHCAGESLLLAGDLLFARSIGRTDLPDSNSADMRRSLQRVLALPENTVVRPGHGPATSIGAEKNSNPFLAQLDSSTHFQK